jgi:molecular chaperone Hsp33
MINVLRNYLQKTLKRKHIKDFGMTGKNYEMGIPQYKHLLQNIIYKLLKKKPTRSNQMGTFISAISQIDELVCYVMDSTDIVAEAEQIHQTSAVVTAALGRLMTAASLMVIRLKAENGSMTLRLKGNGSTGTVMAVSDSEGNVRGYVDNPIVEIPLNKHGKLDVAGAVGTQGDLFVMCDYGFGEPYIGQTPIVSGEIAEDITYYYATSEQTPTVCALGVLVNKDLTVQSAGGFIVQLLPNASELAIDKLEANLKAMPSVTQLLNDGKTPEDIAEMVLNGFEPKILERREEIEYRCNCSRERVEGVLISLGAEELNKMADEQPVTEVNCHFCPKKYCFSPNELRGLIS